MFSTQNQSFIIDTIIMIKSQKMKVMKANVGIDVGVCEERGFLVF